MHEWHIDAGQPNVPDDDQLERIITFSGSFGEQLAAYLAAVMLLPFLRTRRRVRHGDPDEGAGVVVAVPIANRVRA